VVDPLNPEYVVKNEEGFFDLKKYRNQDLKYLKNNLIKKINCYDW